MPKISVIVPVYNVEPYLHRCIDSILNQSYSDIELILVDDGSPDNCGVICDDYAVRDERVHVIHRENGGLSAARNSGIDWVFENSDSEWLAFIDSDDWVHKDYLLNLLTPAEKYGVNLCVCGLYWTDTFVEDVPLDCTPELMDVDDLFVNHQEKGICACNKLIKKHLLTEIRFPVGRLYEDAFVTHKLLFACDKAVVVDENMYYYFSNPTSITRSKWSDRKLDSIDAHEQRLEFFKEINHPKAYRREQEIYVEELTTKIQHLLATRESKNDYQDTFLMLRKKLQKAFRAARRERLVRFERETMWSYIFASRHDFVWKSAVAAQKVYHKLKK